EVAQLDLASAKTEEDVIPPPLEVGQCKLAGGLQLRSCGWNRTPVQPARYVGGQRLNNTVTDGAALERKCLTAHVQSATVLVWSNQKVDVHVATAEEQLPWAIGHDCAGPNTSVC